MDDSDKNEGLSMIDGNNDDSGDNEGRDDKDDENADNHRWQ